MKSRMIAVIAGIALSGCNPAEMVEPTPPAPTTGAVFLGVTPRDVTPTCNTVALDGRLAPLTPGRYNPVPNGTYSSTECVAVGYEKSYGPSFKVSGDSVTTNVVMVKSPTTPPPLDSIAVIVVRTQDGKPAKVDSMAQTRNNVTNWTNLVNMETPFTANVVGNGSSYIFAISRAGYASRLAEWTPDPRTTKTLLVDLTPLPAVVSDSGILNVYSSPKGMRAKVYTAFYASLITTQTTDFPHKVKSGGYVVVCEDTEGKRMADTAYAVVPAGGFANAVCDNPLKPEPPAPPPPPRTMGKLLATCAVAGVRAEVRKLGSSTVVKSFTTLPDSINVEAGFYSVTYTAPAGYVSRPVPPVAVNVDQRTVSNCDVEKEVAPPPPPPPPTTGTIVLTDDIEGPVEFELSKGSFIIGGFLTDTTLTNRQPGEYSGRCVKPGSGGRVIGDARGVLEAGKTLTLRCIMRELPPTRGTVVLTDDIEGPVEVKLFRGSFIVGDFLTDTTLTERELGPYEAQCIKPGSGGKVRGIARGTLKAGETLILKCEMKEESQ